METKALERLRRKVTLENLWMYVVKILSEEGPLRGYEVKKRLEERYGIRPATVTAYVVLYKMSREGLIEPVSLGGDTLYRPTQKGLEALEEARKILEWVSRSIS
ncbi:MAG: PadR family transcriptional regulator [Acidilobaceae archaeon]